MGTRPRASKADNKTFTIVIYLFIFFNELKCEEKHLLMTYVYFLTSLNYALKLLDLVVKYGCLI